MLSVCRLNLRASEYGLVADYCEQGKERQFEFLTAVLKVAADWQMRRAFIYCS